MRIIEQSAYVLDPATKLEGIRALRLCEYAGRTCYNSTGKRTSDSYERFIRNIIQRGHTSVLEHGKVTLEVVTGRDVLAEITRHRLCSFSVQSQRYVQADKEQGGIAFIKPDFYISPYGDKTDAKAWCASREWEDGVSSAEDTYISMIQMGYPPEDARKVLPNSTATTFVMTCNFRELLHIIELRTSVRAYPEMRTMMDKIITSLSEVLPPIWEWGKEEQVNA